MTDTERLDLTQHYGWIISPTNEGWLVTPSDGRLDFEANGKTIREAIDAALQAQAKWALRI